MAVDDGVMDVDEQITLQQQRKTHDDGSTTSNLSSATMIANVVRKRNGTVYSIIL